MGVSRTSWLRPSAVAYCVLLLGLPVSAADTKFSADTGESDRGQIFSLEAKVQFLQERLSLLAAANRLGSGEETLLDLLAQIKGLRSQLSQHDITVDSAIGQKNDGRKLGTGRVVSVMSPEKVVLISMGRDSGVLDGAVVKLGGNGLMAKVIESRAVVSAAALQNSYQGKLADLVGVTAELSAR